MTTDTPIVLGEGGVPVPREHLTANEFTCEAVRLASAIAGYLCAYDGAQDTKRDLQLTREALRDFLNVAERRWAVLNGAEGER